MTPHVGSVERVTHALAHAQRHWREGGKRETPGGVTVALARESGTGGSTIAREIGSRLGWPVYDHELLELIAQETGWRIQLLESIDERRRSNLLESLEALSMAPSVTENAYLRHLIETVLSIGAHGQSVIVGRGAPFVLPAETTLRVRLVGPNYDRIAALSRKHGIDSKQAAALAERIDRQRKEFIRDHLQIDVDDPHHYDLVLNTSRWSVAECADLIVDAVRKLEKQIAAKA